jgi:pimeloyl-ACP methyl ester carboxylesterase
MAEVKDRFIDVAGMRTHFLEAGEGHPLVLLHSGEFGGCAELSWEFNIGPLSEHFHVLAPDWLGFGKSAKVFSFEDMQLLRIRHIQNFLKTLRIDRAHFIGNSMGGGQLARAAVMEDDPFPIARMVLCGAGGFAPKNEARETLNSYDGSREHMKRIVQTMFANPAIRDSESYVERRHAISMEPGAWECTAAARFRRPGRKSSDKEETDWTKIRYPTLIIAGGKDPLRNPGYAQLLQTDVEGSELLMIPEAAHCPQIDAPEKFNAAAIEFLTRA